MTTTKRKPQRPRLEHSQASEISAEVSGFRGADEREGVIVYDDAGQMIQLTTKDAKRLHKFLGKAIAWLEERKK